MRLIFGLSPVVLVLLLYAPDSYLTCLARALAVPEAIGSILLMLWWLYRRDWLLAGLWALGASAAALLPLGQPTADLASVCENSITILQANVLQKNGSKEACLRDIAACQADLIVLHEISYEWKPMIDSILLEYPYSFFHLEPDTICCYGVGFFSRNPLGDTLRAMVEGIAVLKAKTLGINLLTTHLRNPTKLHKYRSSKRQMAAVRLFLDSLDERTTFMGDFNAVPWDRNLMALMHQTGLSDTRTGFQPTFHRLIPVLPIDYVMTKKGLIAKASRTLALTGSDHRGILAELCLPAR